MLDRINSLKSEIEQLTASNSGEVEALRIKYLSKKGEISALMADFRNVPAESKREIGQAINSLKELATSKINGLRESVEAGDNALD
ncbi:MAG: phenylalanine--tRNA ligase subunit alpha, partial [Paramuribaculum sp.]|nr:phenylalanine--tRNA ligase subunit alpha [Paramuribaculum sp.]